MSLNVHIHLCYDVCCQNQMSGQVPLNSGAVREETRLLLFVGGTTMNETHQARAPTVPRTGRPNREPLDADEVIAYAIALAKNLGVSIPKRKRLRRMTGLTCSGIPRRTACSPRLTASGCSLPSRRIRRICRAAPRPCCARSTAGRTSFFRAELQFCCRRGILVATKTQRSISR